MNKPRKAIFLDRDGVINKEKSTYVKTVSELEIFSDVANSIKQLRDADFLVIVITNQSAVNRGLTSHDNINDIHFTIQDYLRKNGTFIDGFYYCPHRPDENCSCRKPKPGLLLKAAGELNIDLNSSWMIGDSDSDIEAAKSAGCKSIKINKGMLFTSAVQRILSSIDL